MSAATLTALQLADSAFPTGGFAFSWGLEGALAVVARVDGGPRLRLVPADAEAALRVGWHCGNLHWKVDFRDGGIEVHMDGPEASYRDRLRDLATQARFTVARLDAPEG